MEYEKRVLWLILARSGSKSVPDKNIKPLGGLPLLAYRIKSALTFAESRDVWISTDSPEYAKIAESYGATAPFLRPAEIATDESTSEDAILHAVEWAEANSEDFDAVGVLEPTSPFIKPEQLLEAVRELFKNDDAENIVAVREMRPNTFFVQEDSKYLGKLAENIRRRKANARRQDFEKEITPSGGFYIAKWNSFKKNKTFYTEKTLSLLVPDINGLEIDEEIDWKWAEFLLEKNIINVKEYVEAGVL